MTVLPGNPPSVKRSPVRTSVSTTRRIGEGASVEVAALVGATGAVADAAGTDGEGGALAAGSVEGLLHATANPSTSARVVRTTLMLRG